MAQNDTAVLDGIKRKSVAMSLRSGERDRKPLADDLKQPIGQAIERGIVLAGLTKQDVAFRMGYQDQSALARWISGVETPQFARLFMVQELRGPLVLALAELAGTVDVETTIRIRRTA